MTELGLTTDPRALVPGAPEAIEADAAALARQASLSAAVGQRLRRIEVTDWAGVAAGGFAEEWAKEPPKWLVVSDSIGATTRALRGYSDTLRWAQARAATAVQMWDQATELSAVARAGYPGEGPFDDPGERLRVEARELLDRARAQARAAGDAAATAIRGGAGVGGSLDQLVDTVTGGWTAQGRTSTNGPRAGTGATVAQNGKLAQLKAYAQLGAASAEGSVRRGGFSAAGKAGFDVGAQATVAAGLTQDGLSAKVEVSAAARAAAEGHLDLGPVGLYGRAAGMAGMDAGAGVKVGPEAVIAKAEAFAGLRGSVAGGADVGGLGVGATAEGWVGAGVEAKAGFERGADGKFHVGAEAGAALGIGGKVGFEVTVDPAAVERTVHQVADAVGQGARTLEDGSRALGHLVDATGRGLDQTADEAGHVASSIGRALNPFD